MADAKKDPIPMVRLKGLFMTPPGTIGYAHLVKPDDKYSDPPVYKVNLHLTPAGVAAFAAMIQKDIIDAAYDELVTQAQALHVAAKRKTKFVAPKKKSAADWLEGKLKQPSEDAQNQLPYVTFKVNSEFKGRDGETVKVTLKGWDPDNHLINLKMARVGMGSVIKVAVGASLWAGHMSEGFAVPSFRLIGIKVLKLEQYGKDQSLRDEVTDDDLALLDDAFEMSDLSAFVVAEGSPAHSEIAKDEESSEEGLTDDEIPF